LLATGSSVANERKHRQGDSLFVIFSQEDRIEKWRGRCCSKFQISEFSPNKLHKHFGRPVKSFGRSGLIVVVFLRDVMLLDCQTPHLNDFK
jgi:hypothetical protein